MKRLFEELGNTTIRYWTNPAISQASLITLLLSSTALLAWCRAASFGFIFDVTNLILSIVAFMMQLVATPAYLLRGGPGSAQEEAPKFLRLLIVVWILSLILFFPNVFPSLNYSDYLPYRLMTAAIYSGAAVALMASYTVRKDRRGQPGVAVEYRNIILCSLFITVINTTFFYLFVLDPETTVFIKKNTEKLKELFPLLQKP